MGVEDAAIDSLKIYIRLPIKVKDELQIKNLHPEIDEVQIPRQKRRWCFIIFKDAEVKERVVKHLKQHKINEKNIVVKSYRRRYIENKKLSTLVNVKPQAPLLNLLKKEEN